jgi:hypothetical protein
MQLRSEADHSPTCSPKDKHAWSHTSTPSKVYVTIFVIFNTQEGHMTWNDFTAVLLMD